MKIIPVILSGGTGSRLWPLSREAMPKQLLPLVDKEKSLLQETLLRAQAVTAESPILICNDAYRFIIAAQLREIQQHQLATTILEPIGKNTAPAVAIAAFHAMQHHQDAILLVLPADHQIDNVQTFSAMQQLAAEFAANDYLVTFGIKPNRPETGY